MRYERQIPIIGEDGQRRLRDSTVAVAGCGGLGCNVITLLSMAGIGRFRIADFDDIEETNLNRQFVHCGNKGSKTESMEKWIHRLSDAEVEVFDQRLDADNCDGFVKDCDIIIDCLDNNESRLILNESAFRNNTPLVHGGTSGMHGQVFLMIPGETACLSCILGKGDSDRSSMGTVVSATASIQANEAVKYLTGKGKVSKGELITIDMDSNEFRSVRISSRKDCRLCNNTVIIDE